MLACKGMAFLIRECCKAALFIYLSLATTYMRSQRSEDRMNIVMKNSEIHFFLIHENFKIILIVAKLNAVQYNVPEQCSRRIYYDCQ